MGTQEKTKALRKCCCNCIQQGQDGDLGLESLKTLESGRVGASLCKASNTSVNWLYNSSLHKGQSFSRSTTSRWQNNLSVYSTEPHGNLIQWGLLWTKCLCPPKYPRQGITIQCYYTMLLYIVYTMHIYNATTMLHCIYNVTIQCYYIWRQRFYGSN